MTFLMALFLYSTWGEPTPKQITIQAKPATEVTPEPLTDNEAEAVSAVISGIFRTVMTPAQKASSVRGNCRYRGGFCPGALVELKDWKEQLLGSQSLASVDGFVFSNLRPGQYNLEVSYPRYKLKAVRKQVSPGSEIVVEMTE